MTIGVGFLCTDGVVICADKRISGQDAKYKACKIMSAHRVQLGDAFILSYSGTPIVAQTVYHSLRNNLFKEIKKSKKFFPPDKAIDVLPKFLKGRQNKNLELLIGIRIGHMRPFLVKTWGTNVEAIYSSDFIGFGDSSVLRYLKSLFLPDDLRISINEAEVFGSYAVQVASDFVNYCGGGQDRATLGPDGVIGAGTGDVYPNQKERFYECEVKIGRKLRELLISGGNE